MCFSKLIKCITVISSQDNCQKYSFTKKPYHYSTNYVKKYLIKSFHRCDYVCYEQKLRLPYLSENQLPGICASLVAYHIITVCTQQVNNFTFSFITPLGTNCNSYNHSPKKEVRKHLPVKLLITEFANMSQSVKYFTASSTDMQFLNTVISLVTIRRLSIFIACVRVPQVSVGFAHGWLMLQSAFLTRMSS